MAKYKTGKNGIKIADVNCKLTQFKTDEGEERDVFGGYVTIQGKDYKVMTSANPSEYEDRYGKQQTSVHVKIIGPFSKRERPKGL